MSVSFSLSLPRTPSEMSLSKSLILFRSLCRSRSLSLICLSLFSMSPSLPLFHSLCSALSNSSNSYYNYSSFSTFSGDDWPGQWHSWHTSGPPPPPSRRRRHFAHPSSTTITTSLDVPSPTLSPCHFFMRSLAVVIVVVASAAAGV